MLEENESLLVTQARNGVPLLLPWGHQSLIPGTGFNSEKMMQNPWMGQSAFLPFDPHFPYVQYDARGGGCANYRSAESDSHGTSHTHYSGSLSATVDVKFASVSVTGSYDKDIRETTDVCCHAWNPFIVLRRFWICEIETLDTNDTGLVYQSISEHVIQGRDGPVDSRTGT